MRIKSSLVTSVFIIALIAVLYIIQVEHYLLFHALTEIFSIVIAGTIFVVAWNGKRYFKDDYLLVAGIAYLFIAFLDLLHTLGYHGMGIFKSYDYYANQLWIAARFMEALSLLTVFLLAGRHRRIQPPLIFFVYLIITAFLVYSIFFSDIFPLCFIPGEGQTQFKVYSEYVIIFILLIAGLVLWRKKGVFEKDILFLITGSIIMTIISELSFAFYISNYGFSNMIGHYTKIASFFLLYRAFIRKSIIQPYETVFAELNRQRMELKESDEMKTTLFSIISHDLISPFVSISSYLNILSDKAGSMSPEEIFEYAEDLNKSVSSTSLLLENLLEWSKLEMGGIERTSQEWVLRKLIDDGAAPLVELYRKKSVRLINEIPDTVTLHCNSDTLILVIRNILSNALKYSYSEREVSVSCVTENGDLKIIFQDHGTGMEDVEGCLEGAINESVRGTADEKGSGLGMNLIRRFTEENGGSIEIDSSPGEGTAVILLFPIQ